MNDPLWRDGLAVVACLIGAAFVSSLEAAFVGVNEARAREARERKVPGAHHLVFWLREPGRVLTTFHFVRLTLIVLFSLLSVRLALAYFSFLPELVLALIAAAASLIVSHLVPRILAKRHAMAWAIATVRIVKALTFTLYPVVWLLMLSARGIAALLGVRAGWGSAFWSPDELGRLTLEAETQLLGKRGKELLHSILEFSDTVIREIMVPRTEMVAIDLSSPAPEVRRTIVEGGHSRIPVFDETVDTIVGVLHVKDLFTGILARKEAELPNNFDLRAAVRPTFYVPEVMKISELLREFQRRKTHMAIVVDEYGGTAGVVTLEDVIEEIVGEIQDEYDVEEKQFRVLADNKILADGRVNIWDLEQALHLDFPDDAEYETLAGFLTSRTGYLPRAGSVIQWGPLRFTVKEADDKRIGTVEIERKKPEAAAS